MAVDLGNYAPGLVVRKIILNATGRLNIPRAAYYGGVHNNVGGGAGSVQVYDGIDATGELIDLFTTGAGAIIVHPVTPLGVLCYRDIFLVISGGGAGFTLFYQAPPTSYTQVQEA